MDNLNSFVVVVVVDRQGCGVVGGGSIIIKYTNDGSGVGVSGVELPSRNITQLFLAKVKILLQYFSFIAFRFSREYGK